MSEAARARVLAAVCEVLYIDEADLFEGDTTDLRDLGLDSVRLVLLLKRLGVDRGAEIQARLAGDLSVSGWVAALEQAEQEQEQAEQETLG